MKPQMMRTRDRTLNHMLKVILSAAVSMRNKKLLEIRVKASKVRFSNKKERETNNHKKK
jgi:hypothetical protein